VQQPERHWHYFIKRTGYKTGLSVIIINIIGCWGAGHVLRQLKTDIVQHIQKNITLYLTVLFAILTGIASGTFTAGAMSGEQKTALGGYLQAFFQQTSQVPLNKSAVFWQSVWQNFQSTLLIWLSGLFLFGMPLVILFVGIRSFFIGFAIGFLISQYRFGGILFTLVCIIPQTLIYLPCVLGIGVIALEYSIERLKNRKAILSREQMKRNVGSYTVKILVMFLVLVTGSLIEAFISPVFFGLFRWVFA